MAFFGGIELDRPWPTPQRRLLGLALAALLCIFVAISIFAGGGIESSSNSSEQVAMYDSWVLVPDRHIDLGEPLTREKFSRKQRQVTQLESEQLVGNFEAIEGTYANQLILKGEPLMRSHISLVIPAAYEVSTSIPEGYRAVALPINSESGVEGWVKPGVYVDVVWSTKQRGKQLVTIIVEQARVLSVGGISEKMKNEQERVDGTVGAGPIRVATSNKAVPPVVPRYATLLVSLEDSQRINLAKGSGELTLALRGNTDKTASGDQTITIDRMMKNRGIVLSDQVTGRIKVGGKAFEVRDDGRVIPMDAEANQIVESKDSLGYYLRGKKK